MLFTVLPQAMSCPVFALELSQMIVLSPLILCAIHPDIFSRFSKCRQECFPQSFHGKLGQREQNLSPQ